MAPLPAKPRTRHASSAMSPRRIATTSTWPTRAEVSRSALCTWRTIIDRLSYDKETTALLVIDPYNDFISEGGKIWDRIKAVATANDCVPNMSRVLTAARDAGL